jgi:hypothetical protein
MFGAGLSGGAQLCPILSHPDPLVGPALAAHAPTYIGGIGAVLEVVPPVAVRAASQALSTTRRQFWSIPIPGHVSVQALEVSSGMVERRRSHRGVAGAARWVAELALYPGPSQRRERL